MKKTAAQICHEILHIDSCLNDLINTWDAFICQRGTLASLSASIQHEYVYSKKQNKTHTHTHTLIPSKQQRGGRSQKEMRSRDNSDESLRIWKSGKRRVGDGKLQQLLQSTPIKVRSRSLLLLVLWLFPPRRSASLRVGSLVLHLLEPPRQQETLLVSCTPLIRISRWHDATPYADFVFRGSAGQNNSLTVAPLICSVGGNVGSWIESIEPRIDSAGALFFFFFLTPRLHWLLLTQMLIKSICVGGWAV